MADKIDALLREFADRLRELVREELAADVHGLVDKALGKGGRASERQRADGKRTPAQIERVTARLLEFIRKNPDQRSEQIAKAIGISTADMMTPMKKLIAAKKIKAKGKARGTTYTVA